MSGIPGSAAMAGVNSYLEKLERAAKLDPDAFKPYHIPQFTTEQLARQQDALARVDREDKEKSGTVE